MTIQAMGFDLDGTLGDSGQGLADTIDAMCEQLGLPQPGKAIVTTWVGNGMEVLLDRALAWANVTVTPEYREKARAILVECYQKELLSGSPLFPEVKETLEKLYAEGIQLALITNKPSRFVPDLMNYIGISHLFTIMLGADDSVKIKPHPTPIFKVLGELGVTQSEFVFVGDSRNDILAAKNAGVKSIALTYGYNYGEPIENESPDYVINNFSEILSIIDQLKD